MSETSNSPRTRELATRWGWLTPPDSVLQDAAETIRLSELDPYDLVCSLNLVTSDEASSLRISAPAGQRPIDFLATTVTRISQVKQRIHAIMDRLQYFDELENEHLRVHPQMLADRELQQACETYSCVILQVQEASPLIVFANWEQAYQSFKQLAGITRAQNPIFKLCGTSTARAISTPDQVLALKTKAISSQGTQRQQDDGASTLQTIYDHSLRGEPALQKLSNIFALAIQKGSSDIHIDPDNMNVVHLSHRVWGQIEPMSESIDFATYQRIKSFLLQKSGASIKFERLREPKDGMFQYQGEKSVYVRCSFIPLGLPGSTDSVSICLRLIPVTAGAVSIQKLNAHQKVIDALQNAVTPDAGMVLVVGPTGSGKSTLIAGAIGLHTRIHGTSKTRFSIEDPVERFIPNITQFQVPYHLRGQSEGFTKILRNLLRHDPNVVWVGEIRDSDTADISVQAAATGHLLFSSLHADTAADAVDRLANLIPPEKPGLKKALIKNLSLIVSQRLVRRLCKHCAYPAAPREDDLSYVNYLCNSRNITLEVPEKVFYANERGCEHCRSGAVPGYTGIIPVNDVLPITNAVKRALMDVSGFELYETLEKNLTLRMEDTIMEAVTQGFTPLSSLKY